MGQLLGKLAARFASLADVFRSPDLRRLQLAWAGFYVSEWASFVALSIYAYRVGGAGAIGLLGVVRMLPSTLGVLAGTALADRTRRERVLLGVQLIRAATLGAAAVVLARRRAGVARLPARSADVGRGRGLPPVAPRRSCPTLARTPQELVATNVSASTFEGVAVLVGPALAGILLTFSGLDVVLAVSAGIALWAALAGLAARARPVRPRPGRTGRSQTSSRARARWRDEPGPRLVIGLFASQAFVRGVLNVLLVVASFKLLDTGDSGVGFLNAAFGAGGARRRPRRPRARRQATAGAAVRRRARPLGRADRAHRRLAARCLWALLACPSSAPGTPSWTSRASR